MSGGSRDSGPVLCYSIEPYSSEDLLSEQADEGDMRVLMFVTNAFTSDPRVYREARSLVKAGHDVSVIAWDRDRDNLSMENWDGIDVVRLRTRLGPKYGFASWLWNGSRLLSWQRQAYRRAVELNRGIPFDAIHCHDLDTLAIGTRLKDRLRIPLVYDAHEIYGHMASRSLPRWMVRIIFWLEKRYLRRVDRLINVGEPQRTHFQGIMEKPIAIIMNCKSLPSTEYWLRFGGYPAQLEKLWSGQ